MDDDAFFYDEAQVQAMENVLRQTLRPAQVPARRLRIAAEAALAAGSLVTDDAAPPRPTPGARATIPGPDGYRRGEGPGPS